MRREEQQILRDFDAVMICAETDLSDDHNLHLVRNPHALNLREPKPSKHAVPTIVFVGRMSYGANVDAVQWFVQEVFPKVVKAVPSVQLRIVGEGPPKSVRSLAGRNVSVSGRVESVLVEYRQAWASIVPVTAATGVQMKLIESLTAGTPSVVTPVVGRQARVVHGDQVLVADGAVEWTDAVRDLMTDAALRERMSEAGEKWASTNYSVKSIADVVRTVVRGVMPPT